MDYILQVLGVAILGLYFFLKNKYAYWEKHNVPHPKPMLLLGNTGSAVMMKSLLSSFINDLYTTNNDCAYVGFYNLLTPAVVVRDIELIKDVLIKQFNNFHDNWIEVDASVDPILAKNPFVMRGEDWKVVRTQLTPQYTGAKLKLTIPLMQEVSTRLVRYIKEQIEVEKCSCVEVRDLSARFTGENVFTCGYGLEGKSFTDAYPVAFKIGQEIASSDITVQIKQTIGLFFSSPIRRLFNTTFIGSPIPKVFWDIILDAIKHRERNSVIRKDYLNFLRELQNSKNSSYEVKDDDIVAHAFTLFLDGFETSANILMHSLHQLSLHPEIQSKAKEEVDTVFDKYKGELTYDALAECELLDNIIIECLRLNPIILFQSRICTEDYKFPPARGPGTGKEVTIKKGTQVFIPIQSIHQDPQYYENPERFDPNRFSEEGKATRPKCAFLGFGDGPRICLGRKFAIAQIKVALIAILREFELRKSSKTKLPYEREFLHILNVPKDGIYVEVYKRQ